MARSSLMTASSRRNTLQWAKQMDAALDTATGHDHDGTNSKAITASVTYGVVGQMAAAGTSTANAAGTVAASARIDHVHALGAHDHSDATKGGAIVLAAMGAGIFTADATGRAKFADGIWTTAKLATGIISADGAGRALFAAGVLDVTTFQSAVSGAFLSADATGRAFMATGFFNAAKVLAAFAANAIDATAAEAIIADNAIPGDKVNWSYGATASTITPDDSASAGTAGTVSRSDHVHANTCAAPSAGLAAAERPIRPVRHPGDRGHPAGAGRAPTGHLSGRA